MLLFWKQELIFWIHLRGIVHLSSKEDYTLISCAATELERTTGGWHLTASHTDRLPSVPGAALLISSYNHKAAEKWLSIMHVLFPEDDDFSGSDCLSSLLVSTAIDDKNNIVWYFHQGSPQGHHAQLIWQN